MPRGKPLKTVTITAAINAGEPKTLGDGHGLALRIKSNTAASWIYRYFDGRPHEVGIGSWPGTTLEIARRKAQALREQRAVGVDPVAAKVAQRAQEAQERAKATTFEQAARDFHKGEQTKWSPGYAAAWMARLERYALPVLGSMPVGAITAPDVLRVLKPHWQERHTTATRVREAVEAVLAFCIAHGLRGEPNPARWKENLQHAGLGGSTNGVTHHDAMTLAQLPGFFERLQADDTIPARALEFLILTAARTAEVRFATWSEFNFEERLWTVPGARMKAGRDHRVPLSDRAVAVLRALPNSNQRDGIVFVGQDGAGALGKMALDRALERLGGGDATVHGFRSTFADWVAEKTNYDPDMAEIALAHFKGTKVELAYRRGDRMEKRRAMMQDWAKVCGGSK